MKRKIGWVLAASLLPAPVFALGLGKLVLESALNEPLEARIELLSPTREELDSLNVVLADSSAFARAGVERQFVLSGLKFELREAEQGPDFIRVYSRDAIREPFLNFLVEINWSKGRLVREYTVLLDPPLYDPGMRAPVAVAAAPKPAPVSVGGAELDTGSEVEPASSVAYTGGDYGPIQAKETLWGIASRTRPNDSVSVQQMMMALYRANPEAFINNNINGLRTGQVLRMPSESERAALTREQAIAEAQLQHSAWDPSQVAQAAAPAPQVAPAAPQPESVTAAQAPADNAAPAPAPAPAPQKDAELRLVAPDKSGAGQSASGDAKAAAAAGQSLDLANEQLAALSQENVDLKDRVSEAETIIEDLKRLIALKDDEIAALQANLGKEDVAAKPQEIATEDAAPAPAAPAPAVETPVPAQPEPEQEEQPAAPAQPEAPAPAGEEVKKDEAIDQGQPASPPVEAKPAPAPESSSKPDTFGTGIVGQALGWITGNLMILGAGLGAIFAIIGGLVFVARRRAGKSAVEETAGDEPMQFPDFAGSEDETILPGSGADTDKDSEEATQFAAPLAARKAEAAPAATTGKPAAPAPAPAPAPAAETQEDPLAEVNVFLAYEDFSGAEKFVRDAIAREPENLDFHSKLLEVFYASGDRRKYEQAAKTLHGKVGGSGPHWDMALVMWQEMSPNRALFSDAPADEDQAPAPSTAGGMLDLTSKEKGVDDGLDFDLGEMTSEPSAKSQAATQDAGDVLDVTASVGLGSDEELLSAAGSAGDDEMLNLTGGQAGEDAIPDPVAAPASDDLLDVTRSGTNMNDAALDMDPLDVTVSAPASAGKAVAEEAAGSMDLDLSLNLTPPSADDNMLEFESDSGKDEAGAGSTAMDLDLSAGTGASPDADGGLELDMGLGTDAPPEEEMSLDMDFSADKDGDSGLSLDMPGAEDVDAGELGLEVPESKDGGLDFSFDTADADSDSGLSLDMGADDAGADQTLVVPRSVGADAQSAEDEVATKLDLAKAYVELGDKDSALGILNEINAEGNEDQRRQAQELLQQIS